MALTRRTPRVGELAGAVDDQLAERGLAVERDLVEQVPRNRNDTVAAVMRVSPRTALGYTPADPPILAETIGDATPTTPPSAASCGRRLPLHHVKVFFFSDLRGVGELGHREFGPVA